MNEFKNKIFLEYRNWINVLLFIFLSLSVIKLTENLNLGYERIPIYLINSFLISYIAIVLLLTTLKYKKFLLYNLYLKIIGNKTIFLITCFIISYFSYLFIKGDHLEFCDNPLIFDKFVLTFLSISVFYSLLYLIYRLFYKLNKPYTQHLIKRTFILFIFYSHNFIFIPNNTKYLYESNDYIFLLIFILLLPVTLRSLSIAKIAIDTLHLSFLLYLFLTFMSVQNTIIPFLFLLVYIIYFYHYLVEDVVGHISVIKIYSQQELNKSVIYVKTVIELSILFSLSLKFYNSNSIFLNHTELLLMIILFTINIISYIYIFIDTNKLNKNKTAH